MFDGGGFFADELNIYYDLYINPNQLWFGFFLLKYCRIVNYKI